MTAFWLALATTSPSPSPAFDPDAVTPGPIGFAAIALLAVASVLLTWDMVRRVRRARYREDVRRRLDAEAAEQSRQRHTPQ